MKKIVLLLVVAIVLVLPGMPFAIGFYTQNQITAEIETFDAVAWADAKLVDYQRGWFGSVVKIEVGLSDEYQNYIMQTPAVDEELSEELVRELAQGMEEIRSILGSRIVLAANIDHGPVNLRDGVFIGLLKSVTRIVDQSDQVKEFLADTEMPYLYELRTHTGILGATRIDANVPAFQYANDTGTLDFSGLDMTGEYSGRSRNLKFDLRIPATTAESDTSLLLVTGVQMTGDTNFVSEYVWTGDMLMSAERVTVTGRGEGESAVFDMQEFGISGQTTMSDDGSSLDIGLRYFIGSMVAGDDARLTDAVFGMALHDINVTAMEDYGRAVESQIMAGNTSPEALFSGLEPVLFEVLSGSPSVELSPLRLQWNDELFEAEVLVEFDVTQLPGQDSFNLSDQNMWLNAISVNSSVEAAEALVKPIAVAMLKGQLMAAMEDDSAVTAEQLDAMASGQVEMVIGSFIQQGLIEVSEAGYKARIVYGDGMLLVNDNPIPIGANP